MLAGVQAGYRKLSGQFYLGQTATNQSGLTRFGSPLAGPIPSLIQATREGTAGPELNTNSGHTQA